MDDGTTYVCVGCATRSPTVETEYTLISSRFGWRLTRRVKNGELHLDWRCPTCWQRFKQERALAMTPVDGIPIADPSQGDRSDPSRKRRR